MIVNLKESESEELWLVESIQGWLDSAIELDRHNGLLDYVPTPVLQSSICRLKHSPPAFAPSPLG